MANPGLTQKLAEEAVERVNVALRQGGKPRGVPGTGKSALEIAAEAAVADGWVNTGSTFCSRVQTAKERYNLEPDWTLYRPRVYQHALPGEPLVPSQGHVIEDEPEGEPIRVAVIGDAHDSPHLPDKSRFEWLGAYIAERGIERIVSVGDWLTLDCFSSHTDRATFLGRAKPTFDQDINSFHESQQAFQKGLAGHKPIKLITFGNHEHRAFRYDDLHPDGTSHRTKLEEAFLQWGWRTAPYGEYRFIGGVGFVHIPFNALGRPLTANQRPNKALIDTIHGDDHRATQQTDFKSGPFRSPTIYSAATALPPGFIEGFANKAGSTWRSGICEAVVWGGYVRSWSFTEMVLLRRRYG